MTRSTRRSRPRLVLAAAAAGALLLSSCSGEAGASEDSILVGFTAIESGPAAFAGVPIVEGAELAAKEINESGFLGDGVEIDLDVEDAAGDPAKAIALYKQFAADGASAVLCCGLSSEAGALAPIIQQSGVPGVVTSAILADLADPPHLYRSHLLPSDEGGLFDQFVDAVVPAEGHKTAVLVVNNDNDGMVADAKVWRAALERNGVEVLKEISTSAADTNYTGPATQVAALDPDTVVASTLGTPTSMLARALRERGYDKRILTSYGADSKQLFDSAAGGMEGVLFPVPFSAEFSTNDTAKSFVASFREEHGKDPDIYAAQGYTSVWFVAQGLKESGETDPAALGEALAEITSQDSVYGPISYEGGQAYLSEPGLYLEWSAEGSLEQWQG
ncbi:ABC transporter substrate-binding protein [Nocardioides campestrisoli]|uniref:ABC transporter substrate-binding protein n=1 Tax=Nocardioides campestrisoli TaxID=2736757 RepID=UPI00163D73E3|nr:ABC transporter substrate-binding protein [Nocardioides campestrisoli]